MGQNKVETFIGFCIKTNKVIWGIDSIESYKKKIKLVLFDSTISQNAVDKINKAWQLKGFVLIKVTTPTLENLVKRENCKVLAITHNELAKAIIDNISTITAEVL